MLGSSNKYRVFRKLCFFFILSNTSFANIPLQLIFKVLSSVMRVHSNSYWLAIFWMTNGSPVLKRERWQTTEYFWEKINFSWTPCKADKNELSNGKEEVGAAPFTHPTPVTFVARPSSFFMPKLFWIKCSKKQWKRENTFKRALSEYTRSKWSKEQRSERIHKRRVQRTRKWLSIS